MQRLIQSENISRIKIDLTNRQVAIHLHPNHRLWVENFAHLVKQQGYGAIINVASAASFTAAPEMSVYNVSKAGVRALSETLSAELGKFNISVNVLCPTLVPTNIIKNGKLPHKGIIDYALMNLSFTTSDAVAKLTLNRLDKGKLYTIPQIDAKLFWTMKRFAPHLYSRLLGFGYRFMK